MKTKPGLTAAFTCVLEDTQDAWEIQAFHRSVFRRLARKIAAFAELQGRTEDLVAARAAATRVEPVRIGPAHTWALFQETFALTDPSRLQLLSAGAEGKPLGTSVCSEAPAWARWVAKTERVELGHPLAAESTERVHRAAETLAAIWPEASANFRRMIDEIVWVSADSYWSGSDVNVFGAIFVNPKPGWSLPMHVETLVHETGHHGLLIKQTMDPMIENALELAAAPLRPDQRPLIGVLHGAYALIRMVEGHTRYLSCATTPDRDDAAKLLADHRGNLTRGIAELRAKARFTAAGEQLMGSIEARFASLGIRP